MPQITPIAPNSSHPRLLTGSAYRQTPSGPRCRQAPLLLALGVGEGWAAGAEVAAAADEAEEAGAGLPPPAPAAPVPRGCPGGVQPGQAAPGPVWLGFTRLAAPAPPGITPPPAVGSVEPPPAGIGPAAAGSPPGHA